MDALRAGRHRRGGATRPPAIDPWFLDQLLLINEVAAEVAGAAELTPDAAAHGQAARLLRRPDRPAPRHDRGRRPRRPARARHPPGLQDRRHLRGRVRRAHAVPLLVATTRRPRSRRASEPAVIILGSGPEPDRPGHRVRLLLRARRRSRCREAGLRDRDGQLQPRDGLDRLRHLRPALLRAADPRGRARGRARRAAGRPDRRRDRASSAGRPRSAWRRALEDAGVPIVGTSPGGDPPGRGARRVRPGARRGRACPRPSTALATSFDEAAAIAAEIGYPVLVRPSYVLGGRGMEIVYDDDALRGLHRAGDRGQPGAPGAGRPVPRRRGRDRRRRALRRRRSCTSAA